MLCIRKHHNPCLLWTNICSCSVFTLTPTMCIKHCILSTLWKKSTCKSQRWDSNPWPLHSEWSASRPPEWFVYGFFNRTLESIVYTLLHTHRWMDKKKLYSLSRSGCPRCKYNIYSKSALRMKTLLLRYCTHIYQRRENKTVQPCIPFLYASPFASFWPVLGVPM